jgi:DNA-binding CsgD family transcriptional regulator
MPMVDPSSLLAAARDAYRRRDWPGTRETFERARAHGVELTADDLKHLSDAAWWLGEVEVTLGVAEEAYRRYHDDGRPREAATVAMEIAISLFLRGDDAAGSGWMGRCMRLLDDEIDETPEHGYLLYVTGVEPQFGAAERDKVIAAARHVAEIGRRHGDRNLVAAGLLGEGRMLVKDGHVAAGLAVLDEAMVAVVANELSPEWAGNIYCNMIAACHELADFRRAAQWTDATELWLQTMPAAVLFRGICRVHRSQLHQLRGAWERSERDALRVVTELAGISVADVAEARYQIGEIRRLRGDVVGAEEAYRQAHRGGRDPQPGLALLRLAQNRVGAATAAVRTALIGEGGDRLRRARLLVVQAEIAIAAEDLALAQAASRELDEIGVAYASPGLAAMATHVSGAVILASGDPAAALPILRDASVRWRGLNAPYEVARIGVLLATAYGSLGDGDAQALELDAAAATFDRLGAEVDAAQLARIRGEVGPPGGLTEREAEVLSLVASGMTNRQIAGALVISEKTVARHLSNIFTKLDLPSRTAAAAYAFEHGLTTAARG